MVTNATLTEGGWRPGGPASTMIGATLFVAWARFTETVVFPDLVLSWVEVAVIVTSSDTFPELGAVNKPDAEIEPALADHVTPGLKLPVPVTDAEH
jgi:hypothetical protein